MAENTPDDNRTITVCAVCLRASCWQGIFLCDDAQNADIIDMPVKKLRKLKLESPHYWDSE